LRGNGLRRKQHHQSNRQHDEGRNQ
jgi:hypothetical protein